MYYTLEKAAELLEMTTGEVNKLREQGKLRAYRDGASWKFDEEVVKKFMIEQIKNKNNSADDDLLALEGDEEGPTMLADSAAFDSMFDAVSIGQDGLQIVAESDSTPLTDESSVLAEDASASDSKGSSSVDLAAAASDDDVLNLGSGSGLAIIDELTDEDLSGSNISLGDEDDLILGGSGSGSGSGLDLSEDNDGLMIMDDEEDEFQLSDEASTPADDNSSSPLSLKKEAPLSFEKEAEDDGIFELAEEPNQTDAVLTLDDQADSEAATELAIADDSIFDLADDTSAATSTEADAGSDSQSASLVAAVTKDPFTIDDEDQGSDMLIDAADLPANDPFAKPDDDPFTTSDDETGSAPFDTPESNPFDASDSSNFESVDSFPSSNPFDPQFVESDSFTPASGFGDESSSFAPNDGSVDFGDDASTPPAFPAAAPSTQFTGKDMIILVPCLLLLLLATIGAWELCRTIWSYQEGSFDFGGPVLEAIAKMVKLI